MRPEDIFFRNESMNDDGVRVNRIEFRAAMPSLRLLDAVSLAFSVQCLIPAVLGLLTCLAADKLIFSAPGFEAGPRGPFARTVPFPLWQMISDVHFIAVHGFTAGLTPFARLPLYSLLMGLTGVAISRAAGLKFCADRRNGAVRSMRHAARSLRAIIVASFLAGLLCTVTLGMFWLCLTITQSALGLDRIQSLASVSAWLAALLLIATAGVCSTGWLISLAAMGVDSCEGAESLSRGISYVLSRFRRAIVYALVMLVMTGCLAEVAWFLVTMAGTLVAQSLPNSASEIGIDSLAFIQCRHFLVESWKLSLFFSSITICYVLLRRVEDGVDMTESDGCLSSDTH